MRKFFVIAILGVLMLTACGSQAPEQTVASEFDGYYTLQTLFLEPRNLCLEGADPDFNAAFMADCSAPATGQLWKLVPTGDGYYTLQSMFLEPRNLCLEGNDPDSETFSGAAFMADCSQPATGQLWKPVPAGDGYYTLQTMFLEPRNMCLEGNDPDSESVGGAAFMADCSQPATGQLWKLVPAP